MLIDLQLHSTYSDGYLTPTQAVKYVAKQGVKVASLTDHNTVSGIDEFRNACRTHRIKSITGMELYVKLDNHKMNLLWYNFDETDPELHDVLRSSQIRRRGQVRNLLKKLIRRGFKINTNKILDKYNHYTPINHVVSDIYANPHNRAKIKRELKSKNPREEHIIHAYFRNKEIGILRECYINIERILKLKKEVGGQLILCHPAKHAYIKRDRWVRLKKMGLDGVELLSPHHSIGSIMSVQQLAQELNFITTGGSDFHRFEGGNYKIQGSWDYFKIDSKDLRKIEKIIG
ncbi:PHP domain-containing protein [Patescibacteria group bacterium]